MLVLTLFLSFLFLLVSENLLLLLLLLEIYGFMIIYHVVNLTHFYVFSDFFVLIFFCVFVMESVMALCGLIFLVSHTGHDYLSSSSILKCF